MTRRFCTVLSVALMFTMLGVFIKASMSQEVPLISKEELKELIGNPDVKFIDARKMDQVMNRFKIRGPVSKEPRNLKLWATKYPKDKTYIFYCG